MDIVKNDAEAWDFLMKKIKNDDICGEFRIHTNRKGIRLFVYFIDFGEQVCPNEDNLETYRESFTAVSLVSALNMHFSAIALQNISINS